MHRLLALLAPIALIPAAAVAAPVSPSALCEGWAGNWRVEFDRTRDAGKWTSSAADPNWIVEATGPGKCRFYFDAKKTAGADLDLTHGDYRWIPFKDGKSTTQAPLRFLRSEISDARHWSIEALETAPAADGKYHRFTMVMADDAFFIAGAEAASPDGPFTLIAYTAHRRRP